MNNAARTASSQIMGPEPRGWSGKQLEQLESGQKPEGYVGHHVTSVSKDPTKAADHRNIDLLTKEEHNLAHSPGGTRTPVEGPPIDRTKGRMPDGTPVELPDLATQGAKSYAERAAKASGAIMSSRTMSLIDALSMADRAMTAQGFGRFEGGN